MLKFLKQNLLLFVVFITGACVLVLEVVATRILSPYFGNTIYTFSSVIGVVLASLSLGYFFGGRMADKKPDTENFYKIIFYSGLSVLLVKVLITFFLGVVSYSLPMTYGPLIVSFVLFSVPSYLLGTLSPYAIRLLTSQSQKSGVGRISGNVFFASTLGSIFGTFAAGFYLIPGFGVDRIVLGVGIVLSVVGLIGIIDVKKNIFKYTRGIVIFSLLASIALVEASYSPDVIYQKDGIYEKISVIDTLYNNKPIRLLMQDSSSSSAISADNSEDLTFDYTKIYKIYKYFNPNPERALFIGGGAYTMPGKMSLENPEVQIEVVEIEPSLYEISRKYFGLKPTDNLSNKVTDGRRFLKNSPVLYDFIFSDVYSTIYSIPSHFTTQEFFTLARSRLNSRGIFLINVVSDLSRQKDSFLFSEIKTFRKVFPNSYFFALDSQSSMKFQNIIFLGLNSEDKIDFKKMGAFFKDEEVLSDLENKRLDLDRFSLSIYKELTDNYAPVEIMTSKAINRVEDDSEDFKEKEALEIIRHIIFFGNRHVGSEGNLKTKDFIISETKTFADFVSFDSWEQTGKSEKYSLNNIFARMFTDKKERILLVTHFDSLLNNPGANNSASGVSVLLELMRALASSRDKPNVGVDFAFFDGEEGFPGERWNPYGSQNFAANLNKYYSENPPDFAIDVDMVCDKDLDIYYEANSIEKAGKYMREFFDLAYDLYPDDFHKEIKYRIFDDHTSLYNVGIPSILLIDFDYPHYNKQTDTLDKCSADSLKAVGDSLLKYIYKL